MRGKNPCRLSPSPSLTSSLACLHLVAHPVGFPNASGLAPETMQALAKELNLSESAFVFPAQDAAHDYWVRFFTPAVELPMAGHPTVGTAFVLAHERMIQPC
jgi:PhzF family phenazine biosynthesis protein